MSYRTNRRTNKVFLSPNFGSENPEEVTTTYVDRQNYYKQREKEAVNEQEKKYWHRKYLFNRLSAKRAYNLELEK